MEHEPTRITRALAIVEWTDGDTLVRDERFSPETGTRLGAEIYRTSAKPFPGRDVRAQYLLTEHLPALIAVLPSTTRAVLLTTDAAGAVTLTRYVSQPNDTRADAVSSHDLSLDRVAGVDLADLLRA